MMNVPPALASNDIVLELVGPPIPWKAPYVGRRGAYSPLTRIMHDLRHMLRQDYQGPLLEGPLELDLDFYMPIPKSTSKKKKALMLEGALRPITTPDRDNLQKFISDVLQGVLYENDSTIVGGYSRKWYGLEPKTVIRLRRFIL